VLLKTIQTAIYTDRRVGEDVATLTPHRSERADFPHPVPHGESFAQDAYRWMILAGGRGWRVSKALKRAHVSRFERVLRSSHFRLFMPAATPRPPSSEQVAAFDRNAWPRSIGIPGRIRRNPHFLLASSAIHCRFVDRFAGSMPPPVFPANGSLLVTPPFPPSGPGEPGSPLSAVL
jgi:hypothetical protein